MMETVGLTVSWKTVQGWLKSKNFLPVGKD
jgi:hypothetical protein